MSKRGGFPGGAMPGNMSNLMKQAQRMQRQMEENQKELENKLTKLYRKQVIPLKEKGLSVAVLTQLCDVEGETNGLLTYDRKITKVRQKAMLAINEELKK